MLTKLLFTFSMLGIRCTVTFDTMPEAEAWIRQCFTKRYFIPVSLQGYIDDDPILLYGEQLIELARGTHGGTKHMV